MAKEIIFEARHMHKEFGSTIALKDVDFTLRRGEIRGLIGENGSGKSTIMSIASGMQKATSGQMFYKGQPWDPDTMVQSQKEGISMILQEANSIPNITVAHNIFAGREKEFTDHGIFNSGRMEAEAAKILESFGITHIKPADSINKYSFEDRKLVELVRCVDENTQILVVDETTTALSAEGRDILYKLIHKMAENDKAVVFISHDIDEIFEQCNELTVLRDGEIVGNVDEEEILRCRNASDFNSAVRPVRHMMVGREMGEKYYREDHTASALDQTALKAEHLCFGQIKDFSIEIKKGEIVGLGGLSGCGMHEVGRALFGLEKLRSGKVTCGGRQIKKPLDAIHQKMGYISKNRDTEALIMAGSIGDNIALPSLGQLSRMSYISPKLKNELIEKQIDALEIKCQTSRQYVNTLSGGNKQKVSFAKWMANNSEVIIMDCPTRGVDVGVKQYMYQIMEDMKNSGKAIVMISEEMAELMGMADRLVIMKDFEVTKEFERSADLKQTDIIEYMI